MFLLHRRKYLVMPTTVMQIMAYAVTPSEKLSGSYNSADSFAKISIWRMHPECTKVYVFNSLLGICRETHDRTRKSEELEREGTCF